ncbi:MAG: phosphatidylserine/phosphatidylglycerophosphate/cardiolipin synthase family protein [Methylotenera sp.]|nr:phosphatidylserine/phosphatidylglycerophosphate/cardiolipin synthase family protein [Oligoflexia bacterium]
MIHRSRLLRLLSVIALLNLSSWFVQAPVAFAREHSWLADANTQIIVLRDARVDFALRVAAIEQAKQSIDSATYVQDMTSDSGLPLMKAFRDAQNRGIQGRYIVERSGSLRADLRNRFENFLTDPDLARVPEVVSFGFHNLIPGLRWTDMMHEKILIIDGGTPDEKIWIGGRNNSKDSIHYLDVAFIMRPIIPGKPYLGDQIREAYESLFQITQRISGLATTRKHRKFVDKRLLWTSTRDQILQNERRTLDFERIQAVLSQPVLEVSPEHPLLDTESRLNGPARLISNDFLSHILTGDYGRHISNREHLPSDIDRVAGEMISHARTVYLAAMSVRLPVDINQGLNQALDHHAEIHLLTNSAETHRTLVPGGAPYFLGIRQMLELLERSPQMHIHLLNEKLLKAREEYDQYNYQHTKLLIADDQVMLGSDNFNDTSRTNNDEMVVQIRDAQFASNLKAVLQEEIDDVYTTLDTDTARREAGRNNIFKRWINRILLPIY